MEENSKENKIKSINVKIEILVNGNVIIKDCRYCALGERQFFKIYVDDRLKEGFELLAFANIKGEKFLLLKKDVVLIRCSY